jgi:hypothetical protein
MSRNQTSTQSGCFGLAEPLGASSPEIRAQGRDPRAPAAAAGAGQAPTLVTLSPTAAFLSGTRDSAKCPPAEAGAKRLREDRRSAGPEVVFVGRGEVDDAPVPLAQPRGTDAEADEAGDSISSALITATRRVGRSPASQYLVNSPENRRVRLYGGFRGQN